MRFTTRMNFAHLNRLIENLIRIGTLQEVDLSACRCRVQTGDILSNWLAMPSARAGDTRKWSPLTIGEQVIIVSPSGELGAGIVLPLGIFSDAIAPPSHRAELDLTQYPDGAVVSYNHVSHALSVSGIQSLTIQASGDVHIENQGNATLNTSGAVNVTAGGKATVKAATVDIDGGGALGGIVQSACICAFTGAPHGNYSATVKGSI